MILFQPFLSPPASFHCPALFRFQLGATFFEAVSFTAVFQAAGSVLASTSGTVTLRTSQQFPTLHPSSWVLSEPVFSDAVRLLPGLWQIPVMLGGRVDKWDWNWHKCHQNKYFFLNSRTSWWYPRGFRALPIRWQAGGGPYANGLANVFRFVISKGDVWRLLNKLTVDSSKIGRKSRFSVSFKPPLPLNMQQYRLFVRNPSISPCAFPPLIFDRQALGLFLRLSFNLVISWFLCSFAQSTSLTIVLVNRSSASRRI